METKSINQGDRFGKLVVLSEIDGRLRGHRAYTCLCDCGNTTIAVGSDLRRGRRVSCGCRKRENGEAKRKYPKGTTKSSLYHIWSGIIQRCENPKSPEYKSYGGRGISVFESWHEFKVFNEWAVSNGYSQGLTIERIDVDGDYCPDNCNFIPRKDQCLNKQNTLRYKGEVLKHACERLGISYQTVHSRIKKFGWSVEKAVETPLLKGSRNGRYKPNPGKTY